MYVCMYVHMYVSVYMYLHIYLFWSGVGAGPVEEVLLRVVSVKEPSVPLLTCVKYECKAQHGLD